MKIFLKNNVIRIPNTSAYNGKTRNAYKMLIPKPREETTWET
jgi:hypothetical protein